MNNGQAIKRQKVLSVDHGSRVFARYNARITRSKLRKSIFYVSFLKRYIVGIKGNLDSNFYQIY